MPIDSAIQSPDAAAASAPTSGVITCAAYAGGKRVATVEIDDLGIVNAPPDEFVWLGLYEPSEELLQQVQRALELHDLAIEDAHTAHQRPKLEQYQDSLFVVLRTVHRAAGENAPLEFGETHIFVGRNYLVTVRHGSLRSHVGLRTRCESTPALLAKGSGFVLYAVMDFIVDQYFPVVEQLRSPSRRSRSRSSPSARRATRRARSMPSSATWWRSSAPSCRSSRCATG